jgi:hypothetical protein
MKSDVRPSFLNEPSRDVVSTFFNDINVIFNLEILLLLSLYVPNSIETPKDELASSFPGRLTLNRLPLAARLAPWRCTVYQVYNAVMILRRNNQDSCSRLARSVFLF